MKQPISVCLLICFFFSYHSLFLVSRSSAQITFQKTYGGIQGEGAWGAAQVESFMSIQQTTDGGYIAVGITGSFGQGVGSIYLIKMDSYGNIIWSRAFGGGTLDIGHSVQQTLDGGYIVVGLTSSFGAGGYDVYLIKTDSVGDLLWSKTYGGTDDDFGHSVQQTTDKGYIITGITESFGAGNRDVYLIKTDSIGNVLWSKTFGGPGFEGGHSVQQTLDGGYIVTGYTSSYGVNPPWASNVYLIKTNASGNVMWTKTYGGNEGENGFCVQQTSDGGFIVAAVTISFGPPGVCQFVSCNNIYVIKTDINGDTLWTKTYGGFGREDRVYSVKQTTDGGYIFVGSTRYSDLETPDVYLIKTDSIGDTLWTRAYGGIYFDQGFSVQQTLDGGYIVAGHTHSFGTGIRNIYLIKTDANGNSGCNQSSTSTTIVGSTSTIINSGVITGSGVMAGNPATTVSNTATGVCNACLPPLLITIDSINNVSCNGDSSGLAELTVSGGAMPYTYSWSNGDATEDITGVSAGVYTLIIIDSGGCIITDSLTISEPSALVLTTDTLSDTSGIGVGMAWVIVSGGTSPYTYQWNDLAFQTTDTAFNLSAGTYTVLVTDSNGCVDSSSVTVSNITGISDQELKKNDVHIVPNPNTGLFTLNMDLQKNTKLSIKLYHITGQQLFTEEFNNIAGNYTHQMDLSKYVKGIYYVQIITDRGVFVKKLIYQ